MPFGEHLEELRGRFLIVFFSIILFSAASFYFMDGILWLLKRPAQGLITTFAVFSPTAAVLSFIKIAFSCGVSLSIPIFLYELWLFVIPAIEDRTARKGALFIFAGSFLFMVGALFSYFFLLPASLEFLLSVGKGELQFIISLDSYVSFVLLLMLGGGVVFEMPVLVFLLARFGILTARKMVEGWRIAAVLILIGAAFLTPTPDVVNMILMSVPMFGLYVVSIAVAGFAQRRKKNSK